MKLSKWSTIQQHRHNPLLAYALP